MEIMHLPALPNLWRFYPYFDFGKCMISTLFPYFLAIVDTTPLLKFIIFNLFLYSIYMFTFYVLLRPFFRMAKWYLGMHIPYSTKCSRIKTFMVFMAYAWIMNVFPQLSKYFGIYGHFFDWKQKFFQKSSNGDLTEKVLSLRSFVLCMW